MVAGRLPHRERQDVALAFGHTIRRHAEALLGDHDDAPQQYLALRVVLQFSRCFHEGDDVLQCFASLLRPPIEAITCQAGTKLHFINRKTGKFIGPRR